jgi:glycerate kinase
MSRAVPPAGRVVIAPDKFKGTLRSADAAASIATGIRRVIPEAELYELPIADGGEGTVDAALAAGYRELRVPVTGPTGQPREAAIAISGGTAIVESAQACGLALLPGGTPAPLTATSYGAGELIRHAIEAGCTRVILGLGGSACTDGGAGMAQALGARLRDCAGADLPRGGAALGDLDDLRLKPLSDLVSGVEIILACDVTSPLCGDHGAAAVYGPQKGASPQDVMVLDAALRQWADVVRRRTGVDRSGTRGAGAAGGIGFAGLALLGARIQPGIAVLLGLLGFDQAVRGARLIVTGEGCLDAQTLNGKAPAGIAAAAATAGVPVAAVAGRVELSEHEWREAGFCAAYSLTDLASPDEDHLARAGELAERAGARLAADWLQ